MRNKLPFILIILVAAATAVATVVESVKGSDGARILVYNSWWYIGLWILVAMAGLWLMLKKKMWKKPAIMLIHISFLLILSGASVTHFTSKSGFVHIREKEAVHEFWVKTDNGQFLTNEILPFYICLKSFHINYDKDARTPSDYISEVILATSKGNIPTTISMNKIGRCQGYRIYQASYDDDLHGTVLTISYDPWGTAITYLGYLLLALGMILSVGKPKRQKTQEEKTSVTSGKYKQITIWVVGCVLASYMVIALAAHPLMPVLRSPMLFIHVSVICISYVLLFVSFVRRDLLRLAVYMLSAGIFLGAIWANISWGTYWSWDPKESWALVTLIIYSLPLHEKSLPWFKSQKHYRIYSIIALLSLLMTYFGCNYLLSGMHSYIN